MWQDTRWQGWVRREGRRATRQPQFMHDAPRLSGLRGGGMDIETCTPRLKRQTLTDVPLLLILVHQVHVLVCSVEALNTHALRNVPTRIHSGGAATGAMRDSQTTHVVQPCNQCTRKHTHTPSHVKCDSPGAAPTAGQ